MSYSAKDRNEPATGFIIGQHVRVRLPDEPHRFGIIIGFGNPTIRPDCVRVRLDGLSSSYTYHKSFLTLDNTTKSKTIIHVNIKR